MTVPDPNPLETTETRRNWREIFTVLGAVLSPGLVAGILLALSSVSPPTAVRPSVGLTDATTFEPTEDLDIESDSEAIAKERRLRDIELQLAAARRQEEKERRYQQSFAAGVRIETLPGTSIFAFGQAGDLVRVSCEETEFGQVATLSTSAEPSAFFVARYLSGCIAGELAAGTEIGATLGPLGWEQHNQMNGAAEEPSPDFIEWALSGYTGEYVAPTAESDLHLDEITEAIRPLAEIRVISYHIGPQRLHDKHLAVVLLCCLQG